MPKKHGTRIVIAGTCSRHWDGFELWRPVRRRAGVRYAAATSWWNCRQVGSEGVQEFDMQGVLRCAKKARNSNCPRINLSTFCVHAPGKLIGFVGRKRIAGDAWCACIRSDASLWHAAKFCTRRCFAYMFRGKRVRQGRLPLLFLEMLCVHVQSVAFIALSQLFCQHAWVVLRNY